MTAQATLRRFAPAKVNLFLHVGDKRADGYHDLSSLVVFADVGDWLTAKPAERLSLRVTGPFAASLANEEDNLILKAARALSSWAADRGTRVSGVELTLEKNLPIASGLGGGSSDAAATLLMLAPHWSLPIGVDDIARLGPSLGADVPVCLRAQASFVSGVGEIVKSAPALPGFALVLVNPRVAISTARIFTALRTRTGAAEPRPFVGRTARDLALWLDHLTNDLEAAATEIAPVVTRVEAAITATEGCLLARMSGSGATCFGIFDDDGLAHAAAARLSQSHPDWWVRPARTYSRDQ